MVEAAMPRRTVSTAFAAALACAVLLPLLGHRALAMWDEGIYAEVSREMLGGSWLVPHWNGQPWLEKPPLEIWLTAISFKMCGIGEWQARIVSALAGIGTVALLHAWLTRHRGNLAAWFSTVFLLSCFGFQHVARAGETDALLSLACVVALLGLSAVLESKPLGWLLFWFGFAMALMTKGAASVTILIVLLVVTVVEGRRVLRNAHHFAMGVALFLALTLPWHLALLHRFGKSFVDEYFGAQTFARASSAIEGHNTHWWFYLLVLAVSAAPWALLYPVGILQTFRQKSSMIVLRPLAIFAFIELILFSIARTRLPHYIAPIYAPLSAITGAWIAECCEALDLRHRSRAFQVAAALAAVAVFSLAAALTAGPRKQLHSPRRADGVLTPDNRETAAMLRSAFARPSAQLAATAGPLLLWTEEPIAPITTAAFYSRRTVVEVEPDRHVPGNPPHLDKYTYAPQPLASQITAGPRAVLLDRVLAAQLPPQTCLTSIQTSPDIELGLISRCSASNQAKQVDPASALR